MNYRHNEMSVAPGCRGCGLSRRKFLAGCAACAAGTTGLAGSMARAAPEQGAKPRLRLVFSHPTPERITWPNIGYDYDGRGKQLLEQLAARCPGVELLPVHVLDSAEAEKVMAEDSQVDGHLVYMLGIGGGGRGLVQTVAKSGRPMVVVEDH